MPCPAPGDPAAAGFAAGKPIGLLGLDLSTRRRNRANGRRRGARRQGPHRRDRAELRQLRAIHPDAVADAARAVAAGRPRRCPRLDASARRLIETADTFFVASRSRAGIGDGGLDVSHRGGRPGFVAVRGDTLVVPDFRGNRFFNTLGNLLGDPRAGLLFIDFATGDLLQLQGTVTIDWTAAATAACGRAAELAGPVERGWRRPGALPFDWTFGDYAPTTLATGRWAARTAADPVCKMRVLLTLTRRWNTFPLRSVGIELADLSN